MNDAAKFRLIDKIDIVGTCSTARGTLKEYQKEINGHPDMKIQIYRFIDSATSRMGVYFYISLEDLEEEASKEQQI